MVVVDRLGVVGMIAVEEVMHAVDKRWRKTSPGR